VIVGTVSEQKSCLGIIGGFGPDTSSKFQLNLVQRFKKQFDRQPKIVMVNAPVSKLAEKLAITGNPFLLREFLIDSTKTLCAAGVSAIVLPCNTAHVFISDLRKVSTAPVVSIIEETAKATSKQFSKVGLLATSSTARRGLFQDEFSKIDVRIVLPHERQQKNVDMAIQKILDKGESNKQIDKFMVALAKSLEIRGAEAIILACTDLQFVDLNGANVPIIDSLRVLEDISLEILQKI